MRRPRFAPSALFGSALWPVVPAARVLEHIAHEAAVDLQHGDGELPQARERREPGAEIIERDTAPELPQTPHERLGTGEIGDRCVFGELEAEQLRIQPTRADDLDQIVGKGVVVERLA